MGACFETRPGCAGSLLRHEAMLLLALRKMPHPEAPREARPRRMHDIIPALRHSCPASTLGPSYRIPRYPTLARVEGLGAVERPMAASHARRAGDRALDEGAGAVDCPFDVQALGQACSNRRGEGAAGPVSMAGWRPPAVPPPGPRPGPPPTPLRSSRGAPPLPQYHSSH